MKIAIRLASMSLAFLAFTAPALAQGVTLTVENVRNDAGSIVILIFDDPEAYENADYWRAADYAEIPALEGSVTHDFSRLSSGPYAIFVFHDENSDGDINYTETQWLEGVGVSGANDGVAEPTFEQASVDPGPVSIRLYYAD